MSLGGWPHARAVGAGVLAFALLAAPARARAASAQTEAAMSAGPSQARHPGRPLRLDWLGWAASWGVGVNNDIFASDRSRLDYRTLVVDVVAGPSSRWALVGVDLQLGLTLAGAQSFFAGVVAGPRYARGSLTLGADAALGGRAVFGWTGALMDASGEWLFSSQVAAHATWKVGPRNAPHIGIWAAFRQDLSFRTAMLPVQDFPPSMMPTGQLGVHLGGYSTVLGIRIER